MNIKLMVFGIAILSNCDVIDQNHFEVDKKLELFVDRFYSESNQRGHHIQHENLMISFEPLRELAGETLSYSSIPTIHIDPIFFNKFSKENKPLYIEYVVFHEMGHALLYRDHSYSFTIMTPNNKLIEAYSTNYQTRSLLIDELFGMKGITSHTSHKDSVEEIPIIQECTSMGRSTL